MNDSAASISATNNAVTMSQEITAEQFQQEVIEYQGKVLIDFYAPWCGPCKMIAPIVEQIAQEQSDLKVLKVNADNSQALMASYGIRGIPTLLLIENGELKATQVGAASLKQVQQFVNG
ncbi:thioredoxin [Litorilituus lipolyticus]|uniref:Thioredoxin n=1 Tax=Litorilituus lipolyticus TaxID=2491017 RepID=A0A502KU71_9GAMM|nr:thioredoxin [Litorilituus lipolyticus]TPH15026.1 thioredoxin [Litorilituus lipolyticus]